ncbi:MAG: sodium/solute symporter [Planctomycetota bacterium]
MPIGTLATFFVLDWAVLAGYFVLLAATGYVFSRREQRTTDDYFLGGRRMPIWAVAVSIVATSMSAASFVGVPQQGYAGDLTYLSTNLGMIIAAVVVALVFIPAFYRAGVSSIYGLLADRFSPAAMRAASLAFLAGRVMASGARIYIGAIPLSLVLFGIEDGMDPANLLTAIGVLTAVGITYTFIGGIASVIWTDVIQMVVLLSAALLAIVVIVSRVEAPWSEVAAALRYGGDGLQSKLTLINTDPDPRVTFGLLTATVGFAVLGIGSYGTDQDLVQRMLTCKDAKAGSRSVMLGIFLGIPSVLVFLVVGLLLFVYYQRPELMGAAAPAGPPTDERQVFLEFILEELPAGIPGLMMAGLFAAGLSSLNSAINAMSSSLVSDFYRHAVPDREPEHYVRVGRICVVGFGVLLGVFAVVCVFWQSASAESGDTLLTFALRVMTFAYSGLVGVFFAALLTTRGSTRSVIASLVIGFVLVLSMEEAVWTAALGDDGAMPEWLRYVVSLAFAWKLTAAAAVSFTVAVLPKGRSA